MKVNAFFDEDTSTLTYVVYDETTNDAVVIDPVLDYDPASSKYDLTSVNSIIEFVKAKELTVHYILETHAHADHLTGSQFLKPLLGNPKVAIGANIKKVQSTFKTIFNFKDFNENGVQFDELFDDQTTFHAGSLRIHVMFTPGHTPACSSYYINESAVFTGDALFMHDYGTGRCDFPGGSSADLYDSVMNRLYTLPDDTKVFVGHDYQPNGRAVQYESTIGLEKSKNPQLGADTTKDEFISFRDGRDATLKSPRLLLQSLQVNIDAGHLPPPEDNGSSYLKMPLRPGS
ncbi:MAG: MBL fold metallo-hydrolase [Candidatus Marinamargulisbacteria bacterium]